MLPQFNLTLVSVHCIDIKDTISQVTPALNEQIYNSPFENRETDFIFKDTQLRGFFIILADSTAIQIFGFFDDYVDERKNPFILKVS